MKVLYICTHNRCRSILSEAITNHHSKGAIEARSAGSQPSGEVHPSSLKFLNEAGIATGNLKSQSWDEFEDFEADIVITVCDSAAGESCPVWFGKSLKVHWALSDPSKVEGTEAEIRHAFESTIAQINERVSALKALASIQSRDGLKVALANIGAH